MGILRLTRTPGKRRPSHVQKSARAVPIRKSLSPPPFTPGGGGGPSRSAFLLPKLPLEPEGLVPSSSTGVADPFPWLCVQTIREER
jgi:hypothetical protein